MAPNALRGPKSGSLGRLTGDQRSGRAGPVTTGLKAAIDRIAPILFESEMGAGTFLEYMDYHVDIVKHHPATGIHAFRMMDFDSIGRHLILNMVRDGFDMHRRFAGADDEEVSQVSQFADIEDANVFGLFGVSQAGDSFGKINRLELQGIGSPFDTS